MRVLTKESEKEREKPINGGCPKTACHENKLPHASMSKILGKKKRAQKNSRIYSECNNMSQSINQIGKRLSIRFRV